MIRDATAEGHPGVANSEGERRFVRCLRRGWPALVAMLVASITFWLAQALYPSVPLVSDAFGYMKTAWSLVSKGFFGYGGLQPDAFITPGYPSFLAVLYLLAPRAASFADAARAIHPTVLAVQLVFAVGTVGLVAECGMTLGGAFLGLTAGLLAALYLPLAWASSLALSETLGTFLLTLQLLFALRLLNERRSPKLSTFALFGLVTGLVVLVRPAFVLWAAVPMLWVVVRHRLPTATLVRGCALTALGFVLVMAPWWVRNAVVLHEFVLLADNGGEVRLAGAGGYPLTHREQRLYDRAAAAGGDGASAVADERLTAEWDASPERFLRARLADAITATLNPYVAPEVYYYLEAAGLAEGIDRIEFGPRASRAPPILGRAEEQIERYHLVLVLLACLSVLFVRRWPRLLLVASVPVYAVVVHAPLLILGRYFFPAMPAVIVLAAATVCGAVLAIRRAAGIESGVGPASDA